VYGVPQYLPYDENHPTCPINPYGQTKLVVEAILQDLARSSDNWRIASLRYFNPMGAHESGLMGEMPKGIPNNLMPHSLRVPSKEVTSLKVYGDDCPTKDGASIRDYIHVVDLDVEHIKALDFLKQHKGYEYSNLGTGQPYSVLEMVKTFELFNQMAISLEIVSRRQEDLPEYYAASDKAKNILLWAA
jgi:UDP-glucose 4-epimerase